VAKKDKGITKTMPMRVLDEAGVPCEVHLHAHKQVTSAGVAADLGMPAAQVVKAMIVQPSVRAPDRVSSRCWWCRAIIS
jgi:hypothetical protein